MTFPALTLFVALLVTACNDRTRDPLIGFEPPSDADVGHDATGFDAELPPDELCRGTSDGAHCPLHNATGVCARERCRFVACASGFDDCDDAIGCETPLDDPRSCGACAHACSEGQRCERAEVTFTCTAGIACPVDRFDLDSDPANGCEVAATWGPSQTLVPPALAIDVAVWHDDTVLLAGSTPDGRRVSTALPADPHAYATTPAAPARAVAIAQTEAELRVLWSDGLSRRALTGERFDAVIAPFTLAVPNALN